MRQINFDNWKLTRLSPNNDFLESQINLDDILEHRDRTIQYIFDSILHLDFPEDTINKEIQLPEITFDEVTSLHHALSLFLRTRNKNHPRTITLHEIHKTSVSIITSTLQKESTFDLFCTTCQNVGLDFSRDFQCGSWKEVADKFLSGHYSS